MAAAKKAVAAISKVAVDKASPKNNSAVLAVAAKGVSMALWVPFNKVAMFRAVTAKYPSVETFWNVVKTALAANATWVRRSPAAVARRAADVDVQNIPSIAALKKNGQLA